MIQFTPKKHQEEPKYHSGLPAAITWIFRKMVYCLVGLMVAAWFCAAIYSLTKQKFALNLMVICFLITIAILSMGLVLLPFLLAIRFVSNRSRMQPEHPKGRTAEILYMIPRKEP